MKNGINMGTEELAIMRPDELGIERYGRQPLPTRRDIIAVLFRQRWPMLATFLLVVVAVALSGMWIPKYEAKMKILALRQRSDEMVTSSANAPSQFSNDQVSEEDLNSEVELLNSDDLLRKVVLTTGLDRQYGLSSEADSYLSVAKAVRNLGKDLTIEPLRKTNVISVSYQARDPQVAEKVLKALAAAYTEKHMEMHRPLGEFKFFDQQTEQYKQGLNQAQGKLTDFTKGTGVVSAELERDSALQQAQAFDSNARQTQTALLETEHRVSALRAQLQTIKPRMTTVVRNSDNPQLLQQLKSTLLTLELKRTELLTKYEPTYRLVQEVDQQIAEAKSAINAEESKPIRDETSDQNPDYQWVQAELTKDQADLSGMKARATAAAAVAARYREEAQHLDQNMVVQQNLMQDAKTQQENYLLYERKREEARISNALDRGGILNVALAEQPVVPAFPKRSLLGVSVLTLLLAGTFSVSAAFTLDFLDPTFRTPDELTAYLGMPVLGALPKSTV
jgi:uncharacterized protein involved in exopolysaccharide biosynthesis